MLIELVLLGKGDSRNPLNPPHMLGFTARLNAVYELSTTYRWPVTFWISITEIWKRTRVVICRTI